MTGDLDITDAGNSLTITADFLDSPAVIDGGGIDRVFHVLFSATLNIAGVTIVDGNAAGSSGGAINVAGGSLSLTRSTLSGNTAMDGGAIAISAATGFPFFLPAASAALAASTISGNTATDEGGGIFNAGALTLTDTSVTNNTANAGGGIASTGGAASLTLTNSTVGFNTATPSDGGGIWNVDGIDQDCDGVDATEEQPGGADITFTLVGGFNAIVFTGPNGTPVQDIVDAVGPIMDSVFNFRASTQIWLVHRPDVSVPGLNTFVTVNQRDVLFIRLPANVTATVTLPNVLTAGPVGVVLEPGFTFVGYTGASDAALADLLAGLPPGVSAAFRFAAPVQEYEIFRRGQALFLSTFTTANRFDGLFIFNQTVSDHALDWEQIGAAP